jgi:hypothetical protein
MHVILIHPYIHVNFSTEVKNDKYIKLVHRIHVHPVQVVHYCAVCNYKLTIYCIFYIEVNIDCPMQIDFVNKKLYITMSPFGALGLKPTFLIV